MDFYSIKLSVLYPALERRARDKAQLSGHSSTFLAPLWKSDRQSSLLSVLSGSLKPAAQPVAVRFVAFGWVNSYLMSLMFTFLASKTAVVSNWRSSRIQMITSLHLLSPLYNGITEQSLRHVNTALLGQRHSSIGCEQGLPNLRWKDQTLLPSLQARNK